MHPQLQDIADDFRRAQLRLHALAEALPPAAWHRRPPSGGWTAAECVDHLNRTADAFLPPLREALQRARAKGSAPSRFRHDVVGWMLWKIMPPPVRRMRVRTGPAFEPRDLAPPDELIRRFDALQAAQLECVADGDGLAIHRVKVASPFDGRVRYSLYSALAILPRHQHRHLWQAERAAGMDHAA